MLAHKASPDKPAPAAPIVQANNEPHHSSKLDDEQIKEANRRMIKQSQFLEEQGDAHDCEFTELLMHLSSRRKPAETVSFFNTCKFLLKRTFFSLIASLYHTHWSG